MPVSRRGVAPLLGSIAACLTALQLSALPAHAAMYSLAVGTERQRMPLDCEATSLALALRAVGVHATQEQVQARFPVDNRAPVNGADGLPTQWGDTYTGFVGNVWGSEPGVSGYTKVPGWGAFAPAVAAVARSFGAPVDARSGWVPADLYRAVEAGHPVLVWTTVNYSTQAPRTWTAWDGRVIPWTLHGHVVVLMGVDRAAGRLLFSDPLAAAYNGTTMGQFERTFAYYGNMALVILGNAAAPPPTQRPTRPAVAAAPAAPAPTPLPSPTPDPPLPGAMRADLRASLPDDPWTPPAHPAAAPGRGQYVSPVAWFFALPPLVLVVGGGLRLLRRRKL